MTEKTKTAAMIWMDLEMTGLNPDSDLIIEIATLVTNSDLDVIAKGPELILNAPKERFAQMDDWNQKQHTSSGLWEKCLKSKVNTSEAEEQTLSFIKEHAKPGEAILCGNSIWQDRRFLYRHMKQIDQYLHYRMLDVSTVKELVNRWYPDLQYPDKESNHRAMDDILQSIEELKHYRKYIFQKAQIS